MTKILAVSHDAYLYGAQRSLLDVVVGLSAAGHQVEVCVPGPGALVEQLRARRIAVQIVPFGRWVPGAGAGGWADWLRILARMPGALVRAWRVLAAGGYEVVYTNTVTVLDFALAARLRGVPHVWHLRESVAGNPQLRSPLSNRGILAVVHTLSDRVIYNSRYLASRYGVSPGGKDVVVYNGLSQCATASRRPPLPDGRLVVLTAGFMNRGKGLDVLLDALALLPPRLRACMVVRIAGEIEGSYLANEIAPRLERLGDGVELLGWVDGLDECLAGADVLVSSARDESFGRTLVEGMLAGLPVLATRAGGPQEIVLDEVTGLLVPPDRPDLLAQALARLVDQPEFRQACGRAGRERAHTHFSMASYVRGVERCLDEAISDRRRGLPEDPRP